MGDGGLAFAPSQHVMAAISDTFRGGASGRVFNSKMVKFVESNSGQQKVENKMGLERKDLDADRGEFAKGGFSSDKEQRGERAKSQKGDAETGGDVEKKAELVGEELGLEKGGTMALKKGNLGSDKERKGEVVKLQKGEVENGEIISKKRQKGRKVEKGDIVLDTLEKREIENGEIVPEEWRKEETGEDELLKRWRNGREFEKGEIVSNRWQSGEIEKGEFVPEKWRKVEKAGAGRGRKEEGEKAEYIPEKWKNGEVEKGEILTERGRKDDALKEEFIYRKGRKREVEKGEFVPEKGWKDDRDRSPKKETSHSVKFSDGDSSQWKGYSRSGSDRRKRLSRRESSNERDSKSSSRRLDWEVASRKHDNIDGKNHESSSRKHHGDCSDHSGSKSRRILEDNNHSSHNEKLHAHGSAERSYRNSSSTKASSSNRYASRHCELSSSSRGGGDKHGRSPGYHEWSPRDRSRYQDHRDRSPARLGYTERSPHEHSRYHDIRDRTPVRLGYLERSPQDRPRHRDHRVRSPGHSERSPYDRARNCDHRERNQGHTERSPRDRARPRDHRERSLTRLERSPHVRARHHDHRNSSPQYLEQSPRNRGRPHDHRETKQKSGQEKQQCQYVGQGHEERLGQREPGGRDSLGYSTSGQSYDDNTMQNSISCPDKNVDDQVTKEKELQDTTTVCDELPPQEGEVHEEFPSMEEDMDISDTPPHIPAVANLSLGQWFYLDHFGIEQGPSKLCDLRRLVEEGVLQSDHLIKHSESDRWVTVENAASPLVSVNLPSIVSDTVTELATPPEAPGNLLADVGEAGQPTVHLEESSVVLESFEDLHIDERVRALLKGYTVIPGRELETLGEALDVMFEHVDWERWNSSEGFMRSRGSGESSRHPRDEEIGRGFNSTLKGTVDTRFAAPSEEISFINSESNDWFASLWSCKGGDWKRNDEVIQDRCPKRKVVLNYGYPLCQMPKSGYEDPRWQRKDDLYNPSYSKRLDLPHWGFTLMDEKNDGNGDMSKSTLPGRLGQPKPSIVRGVRGTVLPVVRINACVVKDYGSVVSDSRGKVRGNEWHGLRSIRSFSASSSDGRSSSVEAISQSMKVHDHELQSMNKSSTIINTPRDHVCTVDELQVDLGDWYYLDGAGHEHGPLLFSELQALAVQGTIPRHSSIFRKDDNIWVPITTTQVASETVHTHLENMAPIDSSAASRPTSEVAVGVMEMTSSLFHNAHPQFIGYTRGKLHELVMKSYKSREFAAAINEVLDPWISAKQPKKEIDKHFPFNSSITNGSADLAQDLSVQKFRKSGKRARLFFDSDGEDDDLLTWQKNEYSFEDLCSEAASGQTQSESWGQLSDRILARVFHFLRTDLKSLVFAAATCKCWNTAVKFYRDISKEVDLSSLGSSCTDSIFRDIMAGYDKARITSIVLMGCTNVSAAALEETLQSCPGISFVDVRGCSQFCDLRSTFKNVKWIRSPGSHNSKLLEESHSKMRSLKQITEKSYLNLKAFRGFSSDFDASGEPGDSFNHDSYSDRKDSMRHAFRQSFYKRTKLLNARKSSAVLSRDARMRRWLCRKSENGYKRMEGFLATSLKDIMRENKSEFFITKVAEIEDRMRNGYYIGHGLSSVRDDISRMCRDAIKARNRGDARDMNHIIMLFIRLAKSLKENSRSFNDRDEVTKMVKDGSVAASPSVASKYKKKHSNIMSERRPLVRSNGTSYVNSGMDYGDYASDREIRRRLSKLNKRVFDSESETSDDLDLSEDDGRDDADNSTSDTESDLDLHPEGGNGFLRDGIPFLADESLDSMAEDREWGARMTKSSLVPPVTRKYEVIDQYVIIADEEEVQRKMRVALPDDYAEKLNAQKSGTEESDMEIPEVKDYKPRKRLGDEVLEQEVYGIDPYTHNLLLDSMPGESEWPLLERHLFIEEVLLRSLNKKVRQFTGTGNTPMVYPLKPVIEEIQKSAEEEGDTRIMKMCQGILKAMHSRPEDNYVAYRKGLGVVCNKDEGFMEDDFVVEFLGEVYPTWKWFEKQDGIRSLQKNNKDPAPEFYNIYLERPKGDRDGYDLVVVDAMHKANYASRICHSCRPNCEAKVTAVDGQYQIGIYTVRPIHYGEEITFDYNSVTESKEEYEASVCLCGSQVCRGSYLNLTGEGAFQKVLKECHGILDRHKLLLEACEVNYVSEEDYFDLGRAGLGTCLLDGLPDWLIAYSAHLVRFINFERTKLPEEILKHNLEEKKKFFSDICLEVEKSDAEIQAEGVYNQRLQNLALTLDKVRYVMRCIFGDPRKAPPPLEKLNPEDLVSVLWKGDGSFIQELLQCMAPHMEVDSLNNLKSKIHAHDPSGSQNLQSELQKSLLWLRDEIRNLPCTYKCRHDAAADLIHMYAHTKCFFKVQGYKCVTSPPVYISPLDLGPKYADKMGSGFQEYRKTYGENYCLGQLINWHVQTNAEPDCSLARARRGCLSLPDIASFYVKSQKPTLNHVYSPRTLKFMLSRMEKQPQRPWPKDHIWTFKSSPKIFGSPVMDAVVYKSGLDKEMLQWLKSRPFVFSATWDR